MTGTMDREDFLQLVWDNFHRADAWPLVRELQAQVRQRAKVRLLAAQIGLDLVVCEEGPDGVCFLTLKGIARCRHSTEDIESFLAAVRFAARHFLANGPKPIPSELFAEELKLVP